MNFSDWDCTIEDCTTAGSFEADADGESALHSPLVAGSAAAKRQSLRLGLRMVAGLRYDIAETIVEARRDGPFQTVSEFTRRTGLSQASLAKLSQADVFGPLNQSRRAALWQSLAQEKKPKEQPLFAGLELSLIHI